MLLENMVIFGYTILMEHISMIILLLMVGYMNLKLERGIIWKKCSNIPYERVQNVDIHRGIIARMNGFSTVDIQTAGLHMSYGQRGGARSEGHIPAVAIEHAEKIREFVMHKVSRKSSGGM